MISRIITLIIFPLAFIGFSWIIRAKFVAFGFRFKGYAKNKRRYMRNWNWVQRLCLIPFFSNQAKDSYAVVGLLHYFQLLLTVYEEIVFVLYMNYGVVPLRLWAAGGAIGMLITVELILYFCHAEDNKRKR